MTFSLAETRIKHGPPEGIQTEVSPSASILTTSATIMCSMDASATPLARVGAHPRNPDAELRTAAFQTRMAVVDTTMASSIIHLPQETIDSIVDFIALSNADVNFQQSTWSTSYPTQRLSSDTIHSLQTLSLTAKVFLRRSRSHLFRVLKVSNVRNMALLERTAALFTTNPQLARFIRVVDIVADFRKYPDEQDSTSPLEAGPSFSSSSDGHDPSMVPYTKVRRMQQLLAKIFAQLGKLKVVAISHFPAWHDLDDDLSYSVSWGSMRKDLRKSLRRMLVVRSGETLKRLRVSKFSNAPIGELAKVKTVEEFELSAVGNSGRVEDQAGTEDGVPRECRVVLPWKLRRLDLGDALHLFTCPGAVGALQTLTHLRLVVGTTAIHSTAFELINLTAGTLTALQLEYRPREEDADFVFEYVVASKFSSREALPSCPNLQTLSVSIAAQGESARIGYAPSVPATIPHLLVGLLSPGDATRYPKLESFSASADVDMCLTDLHDMIAGPQFQFVAPGPLMGWGALDDVLVNEQRLPVLRDVNVRVHVQLVGLDGVPIEEADDEDNESYRGRDMIELEEEINERVKEEVREALEKWNARRGLLN